MRRQVRKKPLGFVIGAIGAIACGPLIQHLLLVAMGRKRYPLPRPLVSLPEWLRQYRRHDKVVDGALGALGVTDLPDAYKSVLDGRQDGRMVPFPPSREEAIAYLREAGAGVVVPPKADRLLGAEIQFFVRVTLPCLMFYRVAPGMLLWRAKNGDLDALEALVRIDKSVLGDSVLAQRWHDLMNDPKPATQMRFLAAMEGRPNKRVDAKTMRTVLAGLISRLAEKQGTSVTAQEIRDVFVLVEGRGLSDAEMPGGETLTKAVQRNRKFKLRARRKKPRPGQ